VADSSKELSTATTIFDPLKKNTGRRGPYLVWAYGFVGSKAAVWYDGGMTMDQVKEILDRVLTWPAQRQADVAHMVELMEAQDRSTLHLTDEQLAEVRRRRAEKNPKTITLAELNARLRQRYGV
jgi:hypothetical protein